MSEYPTEESGLFHLTKRGWVRGDKAPFPQDRIETWSYQAECPAEDANEQVCLRRVWKEPHMADQQRDAFRSQFGLPVAMQTGRNITLECEV